MGIKSNFNLFEIVTFDSCDVHPFLCCSKRLGHINVVGSFRLLAKANILDAI